MHYCNFFLISAQFFFKVWQDEKKKLHMKKKKKKDLYEDKLWQVFEEKVRGCQENL